MPYYPTLAEDLARAKAILAKGRALLPSDDEVDEEAIPHPFVSRSADGSPWCRDCEYHHDHAVHSVPFNIGERVTLATNSHRDGEVYGRYGNGIYQVLWHGTKEREVTEHQPEELRSTVGGTIFGADIYAAYKLLASFVEVIEAVDPKVCELALRARQHHEALVEARTKVKRGEPPSITCPRCGRTSYHPKDISEKYCGACHLFHDQMQP
jgi:hypothetical protein